MFSLLAGHMLSFVLHVTVRVTWYLLLHVSLLVAGTCYIRLPCGCILSCCLCSVLVPARSVWLVVVHLDHDSMYFCLKNGAKMLTFIFWNIYAKLNFPLGQKSIPDVFRVESQAHLLRKAVKEFRKQLIPNR